MANTIAVQDFVTQFADAIEIPAEGLDSSTHFKELDVWDSLCALTIIAMVDARYSVAIGGNDLEKSDTLGALADLVTSRVR